MAQGTEYTTREYLPGTQMTDLRVLRPKAQTGAATAPHTPDPALRGVRILVVDDDLGVCHSLRDLLSEEGCAVVVATGGHEALATLEQQPVDLVLSDVVMPDMDGYDLYMELKERHPELPVILMTGFLYDRDHVIKRSKLAGLDTGVLFKKPIDPDRLKQIILARCRPGPAPAAAVPPPATLVVNWASAARPVAGRPD